jgi:hypothetical protein
MDSDDEAFGFSDNTTGLDTFAPPRIIDYIRNVYGWIGAHILLYLCHITA